MGPNRLASIAGTKSIMADDDDGFTADCTCFHNTRHTLAHFECHSSHRGLAFGADSPAPAAGSYPYPDEVDCQGKMTPEKIKSTYLDDSIYCSRSACIVYLLCDCFVKIHHNSVLGHYPLLSPSISKSLPF